MTAKPAGQKPWSSEMSFADPEIERLTHQLNSAQANWLEVAAALDESLRDRAGVCGIWSPREVLAHLIGWDVSLKNLILAPANFVPPTDVHAFNAQSVAARQALNWPETIGELRATLAALNRALAPVNAAQEFYPHVLRWLPGRIADYELHTGQLAVWLNAVPDSACGPDQRTDT